MSRRYRRSRSRTGRVAPPRDDEPCACVGDRPCALHFAGLPWPERLRVANRAGVTHEGVPTRRLRRTP